VNRYSAFVNANPREGTKQRHHPVHLIGEQKWSDRNPAAFCISADERKLAVNLLGLLP